ncbi:uncharacterized protein G2W53_039656 [Senna tora]|uniref:Uncharacterized protein n=1 Tax=Senna tora TaxID=362788 RepID=A0A834SR94_9FABA|nr:uncharacterized protein G2W53_039656 [Senna tora]
MDQVKLEVGEVIKVDLHLSLFNAPEAATSPYSFFFYLISALNRIELRGKKLSILTCCSSLHRQVPLSPPLQSLATPYKRMSSCAGQIHEGICKVYLCVLHL